MLVGPSRAISDMSWPNSMKMDEPLAICYNCGNLYAISSLSSFIRNFRQSGSADISQFASFSKTYFWPSPCH